MLLDQATAAPLFFSRISRGKRAIYAGARFETGKNSDQRLAGKQQKLQRPMRGASPRAMDEQESP
jgi:hypothetical protein